MGKKITILIIVLSLLASCKKENDNNHQPSELKVTDIKYSDCNDIIDYPIIYLKMTHDNKLKIIHYGAEFCCADDEKIDIELEKEGNIIELMEVDLGPYTYCFCKHTLEFTINNIEHGEYRFKIIESENSYQRDTLNFMVDLNSSTDTIIQFGKGKVLFCTNSYLANCVFAIEISIEDDIIDTLTAASEYFDNNCTCHDSSSIGLLIEMGSGIYNYSAKELNCSATNKTNNWSGDFTIKNDSCKMIFLDIEK